MVSDIASAAVWASLGASLVIHGCAQDAVRPEPTATRRPLPPPPAPVAVRPAPAPVAPTLPPAPVYEERPSIPSREPDVRIRIAALRSANAKVPLSNPSGKLMMQGAGLAPRAMRTPVEVCQTASGWRVTEGAGAPRSTPRDIPLNGPIEFHPPAGSQGVVTYNRTNWPGPIRIQPVDDAPGALDLVVDVPLERYLPGVLAKELYESWNAETFRAQAIAARSFSICEHAQWSGVRHYDMVAGEASQAWVGEVKAAKPRDAVASTRGMVLAFEGRVVPAYYSSTCGGTPANADESLTRNPNHGIGPLSAGDAAANARRDCCANSKGKYRWQQAFAMPALCAQLRLWATDQLDARNERDERIRMARTGTPASPLPAPTASAPAGTNVSSAIPEEPLGAHQPAAGAAPASTASAPAAPLPAQIASASRLPASNGIVDIADDAPLEQLSGITAIRAIEVATSNSAGRPNRLRITDAQGRTFEMRAEEFRRAVNYAAEGQPAPKQRINSSHLVSATLRGAEVVFVGQGYGHGVGMCQFGAESKALAGLKAPAILGIYYPGAAVVRAY
jgi:stage II sporulation protein D